jgi:hypothetical protein
MLGSVALDAGGLAHKVRTRTTEHVKISFHHFFDLEPEPSGASSLNT